MPKITFTHAKKSSEAEEGNGSTTDGKGRLKEMGFPAESLHHENFF